MVVETRTGGSTVKKKQSKTALLFSQSTTTHAPGRYTIAAHVPTGNGNETISVQYHVRSIGHRRWEITDKDGVRVDILATKRMACEHVDKMLARMVQVAERLVLDEPEPEPPAPVKQRYAFDRSMAAAVLLESSPTFRAASLRGGERMVADFLEAWHRDASMDMTEFAHRWLASLPTRPPVQDSPVLALVEGES